MVQSKILNNIPGIKHSFLNATSLPPEFFFHCHQVHGVNILPITSLETEKIKSEKADGLFTGNNCTLGIQTADCIPALFSSRNGKSIAAIHAGWRGVNLGILQHALKLFAANGVLAKDVFVALGPAIGPCCFEIGPDVIEAFRTNWGELDRLEQYIRRRNTNEAISAGQATIKGSGYFLDLKGIAVEQIKKAGVPIQNIDSLQICTYCSNEHWASFRRSTHSSVPNESQKKLRQWSIISRHL